MKKDNSSLIGKRFGRLVVLSLAGVDKGHNRRWLCRCDCGNEKIILGIGLKNGNVKSCTCLRKDLKSIWNVTHKQTGSTTYRIWDGMISRCYNPKNPQWKWYGGKGITVCDKWRKFAGFFEDMGVRPAGLTIDRIDSNRNYEKDNCHWVSMTDNLRNRSCVKLTPAKAENIRKLLKTKITQKQIAKIYNIDPSAVSNIHTGKAWKLI